MLTVPSQYKHSLMNFFIENKENFPTNSPVHSFFFSLLALQSPSGVVFYSPLADFSLLAYEVS